MDLKPKNNSLKGESIMPEIILPFGIEGWFSSSEISVIEIVRKQGVKKNYLSSNEINDIHNSRDVYLFGNITKDGKNYTPFSASEKLNEEVFLLAKDEKKNLFVYTFKSVLIKSNWLKYNYDIRKFQLVCTPHLGFNSLIYASPMSSRLNTYKQHRGVMEGRKSLIEKILLEKGFRKEDLRKKITIERNDNKIEKEEIKKVYKVAGVSHENDDGSSRQEYLSQLKNTSKIKLIRDNNNKWDQYAIKVVIPKNKQIGFIPMDYSKEISSYIDQKYKVSGSIMRR